MHLDSPSSPDTRERLIQAAGEVFAEQGFKAATVREICARAGANVAAVNYHFGDKENLYAEALTHAQKKAIEQYPATMGLGPNPTPEDRLRAFVRAFLMRIFDPKRPSWWGKLLSREMIEPTAALDIMIDGQIRPQAALLGKVVADVIGPSATPDDIRRCTQSIAAQCVFYHHMREVIARLFPGGPTPAEEAEELIEHVTRFSLEGLRRYRPET